MSSNEKFQSDLKNGKKGERHIARQLKEIVGASRIVWAAPREKGFDFKLEFKDGDVYLLEAKTDFYASKSGNLYLEYQYRNEPSGLSVTKSDFYCILVPHINQIFVFCPHKMLAHLKESSHRNLRGGDGASTAGYVVPINAVRKLPFVIVYDTNTRITNG